MSSIGSPNPLLFGGATSYEIKRSLRFDSADNKYLYRSWSGDDADLQKQTYSFWVKKTQRTDSQANAMYVLTAWNNSNTDRIGFTTDNQFFIELKNGNSTEAEFHSDRVFKDCSSWYHLVVAFDTTQGTTDDRMKVYINGELITDWDTKDTIGQNYSMEGFGRANKGHFIGAYAGGNTSTSGGHFDGYITEAYFIDGQQLAPTDFAETNADTGQWVPKKFAGTYGTRGWYLNFKDNTNTTATTLGKDSSGNDNDWTPHYFSVSAGVDDDSVEDTPTNNFCIVNINASAKAANSGVTASDGGLYLVRSGGSNTFWDSSFSMSSGKWYWEAKTGSSISDYPRIGIWNRGGYQNRLNYPGEGNSGVASDDHVRGWGASGVSFGASGDSASGLPTFSTDDVLMFALDMDNGKIWFGKNGTWYTDDNSTTTTAAAIAAGTATPKFADLKSGAETQFRQSEKAWTPIFHMNSGDKWYINFGQKAFTHASAVPSGFKSMCTKNLPEPAIIKPTDYYGTIMYTGNDYNGTRAITGLDFAPDFIWNKCHTHASANNCWDTVRTLAALKDLRPDGDQGEGGEQSDKYGYITALAYTNPGTGGYNHVTGSEGGGNSGSDGNAAMNVNGRGYVSWCWKKSATAGFDIVTYTGDGSDGTSINHSLGVKPDLISVKRRDGTSAWVTECPHTHNGRGMHWNLDNGSWTAGTNTITLNTSNFTFANSGDSNRKVNFNGETYVAYLWASIPGFSKIYGYSGNGNADGEFIYTGFRPAYVVYKATDEAYWWIIHDTGRDPDNVVKRRSWINESNAENNSGAYADFYANGIKFRTSDAGNNSNSINHIVIAFAAQTLKYANAH